MFKAIAIDDEPVTLKHLAHVIKQEPRVELLKEFTFSSDALEFLKSNKADIVFLDIEMPETDGLTLAGQISALYPAAIIIFITAHPQYALDAFKVQAFSYLLKPIQAKQITNEIDKIERLLSPIQADSAGDSAAVPSPETLYVRCFGSFLCSTDSDGKDTVKWRTLKAEELFALLVYYQGRPHSRESIIAKLWPETDAAKASNNFRVTCTYLRKALGNAGFSDILKRDHENYYIDITGIVCDLYIFRDKTDHFSKLSYDEMLKINSLFTESFLSGNNYEWSSEASHVIESSFIGCEKILTSTCIKEGHFMQASVCLQILLKLGIFDEELIFPVIEGLASKGEISQIKILIENCSHQYMAYLDMDIPEDIRKFAESKIKRL